MPDRRAGPNALHDPGLVLEHRNQDGAVVGNTNAGENLLLLFDWVKRCFGHVEAQHLVLARGWPRPHGLRRRTVAQKGNKNGEKQYDNKQQRNDSHDFLNVPDVHDDLLGWP